MFLLKKIRLIISCLLLGMLFLMACSNKDVTEYDYTYRGGNELWKAEYHVDCIVTFTEKDGKLDGESNSEELLTVTYQGELSDLTSVRHFELSYETANSSSKNITDYGDGEGITSKTFKLNSGGRNCALPLEDDIIKVTVNTDGKAQTFELVNEK